MNPRLFKNFDFDAQYGFLPKELPLTQLPDTSDLNKHINHIAKNIPTFLSTKKLRLKVDELNGKFCTTRLDIDVNNKSQQDIALLFLLMIAQSYIWQDINHPVNIMPAVLAKNIHTLCIEQQRYPTLTYSDYILHNFIKKDKTREIALDNIEPVLTFTGTSDEAWFIKIHIVIEAICSKAVYAAHLACVKVNVNELELIHLLNDISISLNDTIPILKKMKESCEPNYFYHQLRPHYNGWNMVKDENQIGVKFEDAKFNGEDLLFSYRGNSGAQSSILPAMDAFLGIKHEYNDMTKSLLQFKHYMPKEHRHFIALLIENNVRSKVMASDNDELKLSWRNAVKSLALFRAQHIEFLDRYIIRPSGQKPKEMIGTGGTPLVEYLGGRHENTRRAAL